MSDSFVTAIFIVFSGGFQDAYTYMCRGEVFANAQTGNIVLMAANLFQGEFSHCLRYLVPVISFMIGTFVAEQIHSAFKHYEKIHWRQIIILFEILLLFGVGFIPHRYDAVANAVVSFVCAMQVQTFRKVRGHVYASTMCIGNMRSAIVSLFAFFEFRDKKILQKSFVYFGVILIFAIGAGFGSIITKTLGEKAIWVCCAFLAISFAIMFIDLELSERRNSRQNRKDNE
ncbi:YoaK family protein [uncultured Eubacterium sp.]|uniref:YoaK family protein n=1 Tax=uncultured Eubacterium sp. TaxID=165185 RepID=UPI0015ACD0BE|nr:YoaK family protein [uncultured Eubacterium sp.]